MFAKALSFFFQAEDGIRDDLVTGVQTCALPIWMQSETTFARFSKKHGGLSPVLTERPHVWESRGPPFTSGCKSLAFRVPREIPSSRSRFAIIRATLQSIDTI